MIDCHVHTKRCRHAGGTMLEYLAVAEDAGVSVLAFTDHLPLLDGSETDYAMRLEELAEYVAEVGQLRSRHADPEVLLGIEADYVPGQETRLASLLAAHPFDLVLGSVHFIGDWAFDDPDLQARYAEWDIDDLWRRYFELLGAAARSGLFDVMAHADLIKKFRHYPTSDPGALYDAAAEAFAEGGVAVEVNSAGLRKPCAELYPAQGLLEACRRRDVPVSMGSDAHRPEEVGTGFDAACAALRAAGYDSVVVFRDRRIVDERGLA